MSRHRIGVRLSHFILLFVALLAAQGCSSDKKLDRDLARELLTANKDYPEEVIDVINLTPGMGRKACAEFEKMRKHFESEAIIKATPPVGGCGVSITTRYKIAILEQGQQYVRGEAKNDGVGYLHIPVVSYIRNFGDVTGVSFLNESGSVAMVEYTETNDATGFAKIPTRYGGPRKKLDRVVTKQARLRLYDDGWRVVK